jgi:hypothetical protein
LVLSGCGRRFTDSENQPLYGEAHGRLNLVEVGFPNPNFEVVCRGVTKVLNLVESLMSFGSGGSLTWTAEFLLLNRETGEFIYGVSIYLGGTF